MITIITIVGSLFIGYIVGYRFGRMDEQYKQEVTRYYKATDPNRYKKDRGDGL